MPRKNNINLNSMENNPRPIDVEEMVRGILEDEEKQPADRRQGLNNLQAYENDGDEHIDRAFQAPPGFLTNFNSKGFGMRFQAPISTNPSSKCGFEIHNKFDELLLILSSDKSYKICPFCFEACKKIEEKIISLFLREANKHYLSHTDCFQKTEEFQLENLNLTKNKQNHLYQCSYDSLNQYLIPYPSFKTLEKKACFELNIYHSISTLKLIEVTRQTSYSEDEKSKIRLFDVELNKSSRFPFYKPNYCILPTKEFRIEISIKIFGSSNKDGEDYKGIIDLCDGDYKTPDKFNRIYKNKNGNVYLVLDVMKTKFNLIETQANYKLDFINQKSSGDEVFVLLGLHLFLPKEKPSLSTASQNFESTVSNQKTQQNQFTPPMRANDAPSNISQELMINPLNSARNPGFEPPILNKLTAAQQNNVPPLTGTRPPGIIQDSPNKAPLTNATGKGGGANWNNGNSKQTRKVGTAPSTINQQQINQRNLFVSVIEERGPLSVHSNGSSAILTNDDSTTQNNSPVSSKTREDLCWPKEEAEEHEEDSEMVNIQEIHSFEELRGSLLEIMRTQQGSRELQKYLVSCPQTELDKVFAEIEGHICKIMMDQYANYMFQTLCQRCTSQQRMIVLEKIAPEIINMACDKKGTHALQALVSIITCDREEEFIIEMVKGRLTKLIMDPQGTHFIQKIVARFQNQKIELILKSSVDNFLTYVQSPCGVCVLKALLSKFKDNQQLIRPLFSLLIKNLDSIVQNPYGNYAIQHAVDIMMDDPEYNILMQKLLSKVLQLSNHKFSSNVIERCIVYTSNEYRKKFIEAIAQESVFIELMKNKYGNFVLMKCFNMASAQESDLLMSSLYRTLPLLHITKYKNKWFDFLHNNNRGF